jgi:hypothetical protein
MKVTLTQAARIDGEHVDAGTTVDVNENDALAIVSAGRGTIDPVKAKAAVEAAQKAKAK